MTDEQLRARLDALEARVKVSQDTCKTYIRTLHDHADLLEIRLIEELGRSAEHGAIGSNRARARITEVHRLRTSRLAERKQYYGDEEPQWFGR